MVRSSTQHNKSGQSSLESSEINISKRQKKTSIKGTVGEYETLAKLTKDG